MNRNKNDNKVCINLSVSKLTELRYLIVSSRPHVETRMVGEQKPVSHLTSKLQSFLLYRKAVFRFRRLRENLIRVRKKDGNLLLDFGLDS